MHLLGRQWLSPCQLAQQEANNLLTFLGKQSLRQANEILARAVAQTVVIIIYRHKLILPLPWNYGNSTEPQKYKAGGN